MSGVWRLTVRDHFSAAHALRNYHGKCENLHGHNFEVEVSVEGKRIDSATGMLIDFSVLKTALKRTLSQLDHANLNDLHPFLILNPSSENIARYIWERVEAILAQAPDPQAKEVKLVCVSVSEKETQTAAWLGDR